MSEEATRRIGDYEILGVLGSGGMGKVFKVRNVISDRIEAMKILLPDLAGRQDLADRFLREIKLLAGLNHPNIAALRTALSLNNQLVMVMEYVEGTTLAARLEQGPISVADAVNYTDQLLGALSYAHRQKVIHRDIKPSNMMLTPEGVVKLMDFGIARSGTDRGLTMTGTTMGSLFYMSPEQVKGQATDARSDLYSLGVSLYELITGERPFRADSDYSIMAAHLQQPPKPPIELRSDLPPALNEIILMAIAKDPGLRFQSADAFRNAINSTRGALPTALPPKLPVAPSVPASATALLQSAAPTASINELSTAPVEPPPPQAQPIPGVLEVSPRPKSHRGLYMSLGALIVLAVLVVAALYVPRRAKTSANEQANAAQQGKATPPTDSTSSGNDAAGDVAKTKPPESADSASQNPDGANPAATNPAPGEGQSPTTAPGDTANGNTGTGADSKQADQIQPTPKANGETLGKKRTPHRNLKGIPATGQGEQEADAGQDSQMAVARPAQLEELERQADLLSSQVSSVNESLDNLRRQQSTQGLSLRGDISSAQELMKTHLAKAQTALQNQDAAGAKKYLDLAEGDVARIDKFLGR
jgi:serine/threonine protein kinase